MPTVHAIVPATIQAYRKQFLVGDLIIVPSLMSGCSNGAAR
jgi:hypothetical protein